MENFDSIQWETASAQGAIVGQDFLTWLWYASEQHNGLFAGPSAQDFFLYLEQRISVVGGEGDTLDRTVVSGRMSELSDARHGLKKGKKVNQALVRIEMDQNVWQFQLKAEDFTFTSLKTPKIQTKAEEGDDPDAIFLEKAYLVEKSMELLDHLFVKFVTLRTGPDWDEEEARVRKWVMEE